MLRRLLTALSAGLALLAAAPAQALTPCRDATPAEALIYTLPQAMPGVVSPRDGTCFIGNLRVTATDGVQLTANVFLPPGAASGARFPAVLHISSWALTDYFEYLGQQHKLARNGYVAMAYTTRGFWGSGGVIGVAGPQDVADVSSAIDFLIAQTPTDPTRIGSAGISYGAGLSLLGAAQDNRLRAIAAMSGWGALADQLYGNGVPNVTWATVLESSAYLTGRVDPDLSARVAQVRDPDTSQAAIQSIIAWSAVRSPSSYVDALNRNGTAVFISKNWQDDMFSPNSSMALFSRLTGPKRLLLQPGIHTSAEIGGAMFGWDNAVVDDAIRWFDRWLKFQPNGIDTGPKVVLKPKFGNQTETLSNWPAPELRSLNYALSPRGALRWELGCLCWKGLTASMGSGTPAAAASDTIDNLLDTTATTGVLPILTVTAETAGVPVVNLMDSILRGQGIRFEGPTLAQPLAIRGIPSVKLKVKPSQARGLLVGYLYDVNALGVGTLVTHGARAVHWATPGATLDLSFDLNATAYDVPAGHRLVLVFDTADSLYGSPVRAFEGFSMSLLTGAGTGSALSVPIR